MVAGIAALPAGKAVESVGSTATSIVSWNRVVYSTPLNGVEGTRLALVVTCNFCVVEGVKSALPLVFATQRFAILPVGESCLFDHYGNEMTVI